MVVGESDIKKMLPGVKDGSFCTDLEGKAAFVFDNEKLSFFRIDLKTGQKSLTSTQPPNTVKNGYWRYSMFVQQNSTAFIVSLVTERDTNKNFILSYSIYSDVTFSVADEQNVGHNRTDESVERLLQDEEGQIFFVSYFRNETKTIFDAVQIETDDKGKIVLNSIAKQRVLSGEWFRPFITKQHCYWQSVNPDLTFKNLLRVSLQNETADEISTRIQTSLAPKFSGTFSYPTVVNDTIFFYASTEENKNDSLITLDMVELCWKMILLPTNSHAIIGNVSLKHLLDGYDIFVHGKCQLTDCNDKAHIYGIDLRHSILPDLCQLQVFRFLDIPTLAACQLTCRKWNTLIAESLKNLPKRELDRVRMNFTDQKISFKWLTSSSPFHYKFREVDMESAELLCKQMNHFIIKELLISGSSMMTYLPKLRMTERKVKSLIIHKLTANLSDGTGNSLLCFIDSIENSIESLIFKSNCDFGSTLTDEFFTKPWMIKLENLNLACKTNLTVKLLQHLDCKKLRTLFIIENETSFSGGVWAELISTAGGSVKYLLIRNDLNELQEALRQKNLSVVVENDSDYYSTDLLICRGTSLLADVSVYEP